MGPAGQLSRALNRVFTPVTHPLLPMIAAPGQLSASSINTALHSMGQMPKLDIYAISGYRSAAQAMFFEKCFNELGLPHRFVLLEGTKGTMGRSSPEFLVQQPDFGGAYMSPPVAAEDTVSFLPQLSDAARAIGQVDTMHFQTGRQAKTSSNPQHTGLLNSDQRRTLIGDNAAWKGVRATLTSDFVPGAYTGRAALVLATAEYDAAASIFALQSMGIGPIYTAGFKMNGPLSGSVHPIRNLEDVKRLEHPFAIISALPPARAMLVGPLLKHYSSVDRRGSGFGARSQGITAGKVFVDLSTEGDGEGDFDCEGLISGGSQPPSRRGSAAGLNVNPTMPGGRPTTPSPPTATAAALGWTAYNRADVRAWTQVETLRLLVGQNVPYDFVRMTTG